MNIKRFWKYTTKTDTCWIYRGRDHYFAQRISYYIHYNEIHPAFNIYLKCKEKRCVNPQHLGILNRDFLPNREYNEIDNNIYAILSSLDDSPEVREKYIRAPFGYPGSKTRSIDKILPNLPYRNTYIEPFGGSGVILLNRKESNLEVFNDRFSGVVSFYRVIRDPITIEKLIRRLELTLHSREEFIWCKETWKSVEDDVERAARWYYMLQNSFTKQSRHFGRAINNKGQHGIALQNNLELFYPVHERLKNVQIENLDWRVCLKDYDNQDAVFYLDPPYVADTGCMYEYGMSKEEHTELCERIFALKGFVALSGYDDEKTRKIYDQYPWDNIKSWTGHCSMVAQAFSDTNNLAGHELKRRDSNELLFLKESI